MISTKPKACKGINNAKDFEGCGEVVMYRRYGLCASCIVKWNLSTEEGKKDLQKRKVANKTREIKENKVKTKSAFEKELQILVNGIARLLDEKHGCISCGHGNTGKFTREAHGGHKKSVGSNSTLRFHLDNIHKQCKECNVDLGGNPEGYYNGLITRYGQKYADYVETLSSRYKIIKLSKEELKEAISKARRIIRGIQNGEEFTREGINEVLGIYKDSGEIGKRSTLVSGIGSDRDGHS